MSPIPSTKADNTEDYKENIIGLVTLENVIERILLFDIHDEKDREVTARML